MKRLICLFRRHVPEFVLQSSTGTYRYRTWCTRCGRVYVTVAKR